MAWGLGMGVRIIAEQRLIFVNIPKHASDQCSIFSTVNFDRTIGFYWSYMLLL